MKKLAVAVTGIALAAFLGAKLATPAFAAKVECDKVMAELDAGKKPKEVAKDLGISRSAVYKCRRLAKAAKAKEEKPAAEASPAAPAPAAASAPAAAPPAAPPAAAAPPAGEKK